MCVARLNEYCLPFASILRKGQEGKGRHQRTKRVQSQQWPGCSSSAELGPHFCLLQGSVESLLITILPLKCEKFPVMHSRFCVCLCLGARMSRFSCENMKMKVLTPLSTEQRALFFEGVQMHGKATITNPHESFVNKGKFPKIKVSNQLCNKPLKLRMKQLYKDKKRR